MVLVLPLRKSTNTQIDEIRTDVTVLTDSIATMHEWQMNYNKLVKTAMIVDYKFYPYFTDYQVRVYNGGTLEIVDSLNWTVISVDGYLIEE